MLSHLFPTTKKTIGHARALRQFQRTPAEYLLWLQLKNRQHAGIKFRRQVPLGPFIADFLCAEGCLIIELDGESHKGRETYDRKRTRYFEECGYQVLRFENREVFEDMERLLETIRCHVEAERRCRSG